MPEFPAGSRPIVDAIQVFKEASDKSARAMIILAAANGFLAVVIAMLTFVLVTRTH